MKTRLELAEFIDELIYKVVLAKRHLSDAAEMPDVAYRALRFIDRQGSVTMKPIANFIGVSMPRTTIIVDELVENGYIQRAAGPDRRSVSVTLTQQGKQAVQHARAMHEDLSEAILQPLTPDERKQMYVLLHKCYQSLKQG